MLKLPAVGVDPTRICPEGLHTEVAQTITNPPQTPTNLQLGRKERLVSVSCFGKLLFYISKGSIVEPRTTP